MNATKLSAQDRRFAAIQSLNDDLFIMERDAEGNAVCQRSFLMTDKPLLAGMVLELLSLGRTEKWRNSILAWSEAVTNAESWDILDWTMVQYSIWAGLDA